MSLPPRVVALGGGHGLAATLGALRSVTQEITAVVTVADNGGSSGRLRKEFPILPPGDLRMALAALCADDEWGRQWAEIMQYRFTSEGELNGHAVGNLLLAALWDRDADVVRGLDQVASLLKTVGRVLPMSATPLDIEAEIETKSGMRTIRGQVEVATTAGKLQSISLLPNNPHVLPEVLAAIAEAEWITMGPGSWITSVLPHLLLPELRTALAQSTAKKILLMNLDTNNSSGDQGEYAAYSPREHIELLHRYAPEVRFDAVIFDKSERSSSELHDYLSHNGMRAIEADLRDEQVTFHHSRSKLASTFAHILTQSLV
jgi:uncharacterized cofD-like protein